MKNSVIWSFLSVVALGTSGIVAGCDSDEKLARSALGESCDNTASCDDGLKCVDGTCVQKSSSTGGSGNMGEGGEPATGGSLNTAGTTAVEPPVLGGPGESCTKRADCEDGLGCFNQRCQTDNGGVGGEGNGPTLGGIGETCGLTSDCASGLACLPQSDLPVDLKALGGNTVGVCTQLDSGLKPSGKVCGAECVEAADCCQLPLAQQTATGASSCSDLADLVSNIKDCKTATGQAGIQCLALQVYCDDNCGANTWGCTNGACVYNAKCTVDGEVEGGCPTYSRGGRVLPTCDVKGTKKCTGPSTVVDGCQTDDDCTDTAVVGYPNDTCSEGECTCHVGGCYRKCTETLDCPVGYTCNGDSLCEAVAGCTDDLQCVRAEGDINAKCQAGACVIPCEHDIDCPGNYGGLTGGRFSQVCSADKTCVDLGCQTDDECGQYGESGVRSFCAEPVVPVQGEAAVVSAITD